MEVSGCAECHFLELIPWVRDNLGHTLLIYMTLGLCSLGTKTSALAIATKSGVRIEIVVRVSITSVAEWKSLGGKNVVQFSATK